VLTQFSGKLTQPDLNDLRRMLRPKMYWPKLLLKNLYGLLLLCAVIWATVAGLIGATHPNWGAVGCIWLVIAGIVAWAFWSSKKSMAKEAAQLNATLPDTLIFESSGVKLKLSAGATAFHPWQSFCGWREGERVILLDKHDNTFLIVPVAAMSGIERDSFRQFLHGTIASASTVSPIGGVVGLPNG
jgi:hypothetical protein